ncbi:zinc finger MYM-type protein 3-like isoform X1 [Acipenser ruthenus]|uniref:zinc finger MYM-type protein 3-like isoform X1 n=1 Tax=Acipenser ruthenus TaxID=7906 RepID=UPI0027415F80|nr:zinc finger MYM-type protein 3-like isoform X1 [Acipenser ruthenus]XP_058845529.1 zinc finger MYM-type protein 3-like isoform X1 [Acipenser ruthenus]XP_058845530.1 zinc finger MYM-type protein 3-like isoform X1 [Acipenser ruthenus]XP_058845531.1 zinc finger MYM-type protein 3-like isoform X1 [Acipenser ruthenus]XP_058845532.1 zinc finger MYM-type protein 3-like isoform X1 [Acipenser ruthenus]XP_058845533.1 zinc finger MYM-type protein 3-like isoform X1 [Acipenser ruthenus]XP_058845534.1 zi
MDPSELPGSLNPFQLADEALRNDLLTMPTSMEVPGSDLLGLDEYSAATPTLTQSERVRQKTQDSLSILENPDSLELSKTQVEEFYSKVFPEPSGSAGPWPADVPKIGEAEAVMPKEAGDVEMEEEEEEEVEDLVGKESGNDIGSSEEAPQPQTEEEQTKSTLVVKPELKAESSTVSPPSSASPAVSNQEVPLVDEKKTDSKEPEPEQGEIEPEQGEIEPEQGEIKPEQREIEPEQGEIEPEQGEIEPEQGEIEPEQGEIEPEQGEIEPEQREIKSEQGETKLAEVASTAACQTSDVDSLVQIKNECKAEEGDTAAEGSKSQQASGVKSEEKPEVPPAAAKVSCTDQTLGTPAASSPAEKTADASEEKPKGRMEMRRTERLRRTEFLKNESRGSTGLSDSVQLSDDDSDAMVDDPNDEDFVPCSTPRRSSRMSLRNQRPHTPATAAVPPGAHSRPRSTVHSAPSTPHSTPQSTVHSTPQSTPHSTPQSAPPRSLTKMYCAHCRTPLQKGQTAYQRKGMPQLFCSSICLSAFSKKPPRKKPCVFCKKDIWSTKDSVVAQTGPGNSFQEFCNKTCLSLYEAQLQRASVPTADSTAPRCSICHKAGEIQHEVSSGNMVHRLCSDTCFTKFRATKGLKTNCCDNCGVYIYNKGLPLEYLFHEGQQKRFCNSACLAMYKKKNTKVYPCMWCKTLCKNFDMLSSVGRNGKMGLFCSVCCITSHKVKNAGPTVPPKPCSFCRRSLSDPGYYNKTDRVVSQFCSPSCWTKFQKSSPEGDIHLNCHSCHNLFSGKPEVLDWQNTIYQFCCKECCEDYKRLHGVVSVCEHCKQEKLLHEKIKFSGVEKNFCSEGCILLYKQDFTKNLGLCCITCTYCSQTCKRAVTEELDGNTWDFCSEECKTKYLLWYFKGARCHACKRQGKLLETIHWRGEIKHYCNQQCLLRFYSQQNQPNLDTQKGPESLLNKHTQESKTSTTAAKKFEPAEKTHTTQLPPSLSPPPLPTARKNKAAMCKPLMQDQEVSCRPVMTSKGCQTEEDWKPQTVIIPIPVPVFVPVPMHMYCQQAPVPFTMPIPVPVPMFLPTTLESADKIVETIEELKVKIPSNPLEADLLAMAEMIAEAEEMDKASSDLCDLASNQSAEGLLEDCDLFGPARDDVLAMAVKMANVLDEPVQDLEADFPKTPLDPSVDFLFDCGLVTTDDDHTEHELPRAVRKSQKRILLSESCSRDSMSSHSGCTGLNYSYGVSAWKYWAQSKHSGNEGRKNEELRFGPKPMMIKEDILTSTAAELNYGLAQFVKEISRPNGERYDPDSIYYLCLGIQQYLLENNRMVNIFTDLCYLTFVQELNKMLKGWQPAISPTGTILSRVEEEHLWDCKQLGVYSPFVLLNTLMFFNTKYFGMRTVEEHLQLSFTNVVRQSRKCSAPRGVGKMVSIRYWPSVRSKKGRESSLGKRKREEEGTILEQQENRLNPLRCPVKFFEFYLSKCPDNMRSRNDVFYLQPERSCIAESPLWYSVIPMDRSMLESMLNRILAVKEIYEDHHAGEALEDGVA